MQRSSSNERTTTADGSWMLWSVAGLAGIWTAVVLISVFAPDMVAGSEQEHLPVAAFGTWLWGLVSLPVADVDRAKGFYAGKLGFNVDHDIVIDDGNRVVQLTPPGSGCSVVIGKGVVPNMKPGSLQGLQLVVPDLPAARSQLVDRGVDVTDIQVIGPTGMRAAKEGEPLDNVGFVFFSDADGNGWGVQQISARG